MSLASLNFESSHWRIAHLELPGAKEYIRSIENISMAETGFISAWSSNAFFEEACQMLANAVNLYQQGYFDAAFYSLRQSIELSIGTLYLNANLEKAKAWEEQDDGFEIGRMVQYLRSKEPVFKDVRVKMSTYFNYVFEQRKKIDKYVHKQGYRTFYTTYRFHSSNEREKKYRTEVYKDFIDILKTAIGAVAIYRLILDPMPVLLGEEEILMRAPDVMTEPYSKSFIDTYIGEENIERYKNTEIYQSFRNDLMSRERQNDATYCVTHWQHFDTTKLDDIYSQIHLLSIFDRIALFYFSSSESVSRVVVEGLYYYSSDRKYNDEEIVCGVDYYEELFKTSEDFNVCYKDAFLSRIKIDDKYIYILHNEPFRQDLINGLLAIGDLLGVVVQKVTKEWEDALQFVKNEMKSEIKVKNK